jgi:serine/threonine protein kinase
MLAGLAPGSVVAGYRVESRIGSGGRGVVYRARDEATGGEVALKVLAPALAGDMQFRQRFIRESLAFAAVDHPHIIPVYAAGEGGQVTEEMTSVVPAETGWSLQPGKSTQDNWTFSPDCLSGPCGATLTGAYDGYSFTMKLARSGSTYTGTATLKNDYYCYTKSDSYSGTLTVAITVKGADAQGTVWTVTSFSGHETVNVPAISYPPANWTCYAATAQLHVKS